MNAASDKLKVPDKQKILPVAPTSSLYSFDTNASLKVPVIGESPEFKAHQVAAKLFMESVSSFSSKYIETNSCALQSCDLSDPHGLHRYTSAIVQASNKYAKDITLACNTYIDSSQPKVLRSAYESLGFKNALDTLYRKTKSEACAESDSDYFEEFFNVFSSSGASKQDTATSVNTDYVAPKKSVRFSLETLDTTTTTKEENNATVIHPSTSANDASVTSTKATSITKEENNTAIILPSIVKNVSVTPTKATLVPPVEITTNFKNLNQDVPVKTTSVPIPKKDESVIPMKAKDDSLVKTNTVTSTKAKTIAIAKPKTVTSAKVKIVKSTKAKIIKSTKPKIITAAKSKAINSSAPVAPVIPLHDILVRTSFDTSDGKVMPQVTPSLSSTVSPEASSNTATKTLYSIDSEKSTAKVTSVALTNSETVPLQKLTSKKVTVPSIQPTTVLPTTSTVVSASATPEETTPVKSIKTTSVSSNCVTKKNKSVLCTNTVSTETESENANCSPTLVTKTNVVGNLEELAGSDQQNETHERIRSDVSDTENNSAVTTAKATVSESSKKDNSKLFNKTVINDLKDAQKNSLKAKLEPVEHYDTKNISISSSIEKIGVCTFVSSLYNVSTKEFSFYSDKTASSTNTKSSLKTLATHPKNLPAINVNKSSSTTLTTTTKPDIPAKIAPCTKVASKSEVTKILGSKTATKPLVTLKSLANRNTDMPIVNVPDVISSANANLTKSNTVLNQSPVSKNPVASPIEIIKKSSEYSSISQENTRPPIMVTPVLGLKIKKTTGPRKNEVSATASRRYNNRRMVEESRKNKNVTDRPVQEILAKPTQKTIAIQSLSKDSILKSSQPQISKPEDIKLTKIDKPFLMNYEATGATLLASNKKYVDSLPKYVVPIVQKHEQVVLNDSTDKIQSVKPLVKSTSKVNPKIESKITCDLSDKSKTTFGNIDLAILAPGLSELTEKNVEAHSFASEEEETSSWTQVSGRHQIKQKPLPNRRCPSWPNCLDKNCRYSHPKKLCR